MIQVKLRIARALMYELQGVLHHPLLTSSMQP
jgi:hypothetical protein